jgi:hypothetical protein
MAEAAAPVPPAGTAAPAPGPADRFPRAVAAVVGVVFVALGLWAMADPRAFFATVATFEPYNQHFLQDIGAFQVGLGAVLLLAGVPARADALATALLGVGTGSALHTLSHVVGRDLGGAPETDIPTFVVLTILLLAAGALRWRRQRRWGPAPGAAH